MEIKLYIANLAKYNEGELVGKWITLPTEEDELRETISDVLGTDEEYAIHDTNQKLSSRTIHDRSKI